MKEKENYFQEIDQKIRNAAQKLNLYKVEWWLQYIIVFENNQRFCFKNNPIYNFSLFAQYQTHTWFQKRLPVYKSFPNHLGICSYVEVAELWYLYCGSFVLHSICTDWYSRIDWSWFRMRSGRPASTRNNIRRRRRSTKRRSKRFKRSTTQQKPMSSYVHLFILFDPSDVI